jgi:hypothetical protein
MDRTGGPLFQQSGEMWGIYCASQDQPQRHQDTEDQCQPTLVLILCLRFMSLGDRAMPWS